MVWWTCMATPAGKFLCMYSKRTEQVEPVKCTNSNSLKWVRISYCRMCLRLENLDLRILQRSMNLWGVRISLRGISSSAAVVLTNCSLLFITATSCPRTSTTTFLYKSSSSGSVLTYKWQKLLVLIQAMNRMVIFTQIVFLIILVFSQYIL